MSRRGLLGAVPAGGFVLDLLANGGEVVAALVAWLYGNVDLLLPFMGTLTGRVAPYVGWLSVDVLQKALLGLAVVYLASIVVRLARRTFSDS